MSRRLLAALTALLLLLAACGDSDDSASTDESTPTSAAGETSSSTEADAPAEPLTILVTNDDGIGAPGIDSLVTTLSTLDDVELVIVAPAENQSGSSDTTSEGAVTSAPGTTASGVEGTAVDGTPADAVTVALDELGIEPDLVVSGVNSAQNVGPLAAISGTVGAARTAVRRDLPAVAASAGLSEDPDFDSASQLVLEWITENRDALDDGSIAVDGVVSFNIPDCTAGEIGELVEVPLATAIPEGLNVFESDCSLVGEAGVPTDDVDGISKGFATETLVPAEL